MHPGRLRVMEELPRTSSGKVDRQALAAFVGEEAEEEEERAGPRGELEEILGQIWAQILEVEAVERAANFFELGGHSLLATRLLAEVQRIVQVELPVGALFGAPTLAELAEVIRQRQRQGLAAAPQIRPVARGPQLPLSFAQQRLWFLDQLEPESGAYLIPSAQRIQGPLQPVALQRSIQALLARHESLRTTFGAHQGQPFQQIHASCAQRLPLIDLQALPETRRAQEASSLAAREAHRPFDLARRPLVRTTLLRLAPQEHIFLLVMHHIVADGWSYEILTRELRLLYQGQLSAEPPVLPALPIQYADYAHWQRQWLTGAVLQEQMNYWQRQLASSQPLELPTDHPRPPVQTYRGARRWLVVAASLSEQIQRLGRQQEATPFMVLLAAFGVLLARYSGQNDICVGTPVANRTAPEVEHLIGFFANTLVLRCRLEPQLSFIELLAQVRAVSLEAYAHQDLPFEQIVEMLQLPRDLSRSPLFQVMFVMQHSSESRVDARGLTLSHLGIEHNTTKFDLTLSAQAGPRGLACSVEYSSDLFEAASIERLLARWQVLLEAIVAAPATRLCDLPLLSTAERSQVLDTWNTPWAACETSPLLLPQLICARAACVPATIALLAEEGQLSFDCLLAEAQRLAQALGQRGVGGEQVVALLCERSLALAVGSLAILLSGAVLLPLDPGLPQQRLGRMLQSAQACVLLAPGSLHTQAQALLAGLDCPLLPLESLLAAGRTLPRAPLPEIAPAQAAYLLFTSGSTGEPRGVLNTHAGLANRLRWMQEAHPLAVGERVLQKTPLSFDVCLWELFWPLLAGRTLVLAPPDLHTDPPALGVFLQREAITALHFVPSLLALFLDQWAGASATLCVRRLFCSGEAFSRELWQRCRSLLPGVRLFNLYGPVEAAIEVSDWPAAWQWPQPELPPAAQSVPIGRPLPGVALYVLDAGMQPVGVGLVGELYLGGSALARGYAGRGDLTAERFVPAPFGAAGSRLYRSGDRARWLPEGVVEYLGRGDQQIKRHGVRIELGEIEQVLRAVAGVREAVVLLREDVLVGYVQGEEGQALALSAVRAQLRQRLPEVMVPGQLVACEQWPLNSNGKLDRRALAQLALPEQRAEVSAAETPLAQLLARVWGAVLGRAEIGADDDFFALGGHSLLAARVIGRLRALLQIEIPLRTLFEAPTLRRLSQLVEQQLRRGQGLLAPPLLPRAEGSMLPLSFAQQRLWFLDQLDPQNTAFLLPEAWRLRGTLQVQALARSLCLLRQRHASLRTTFELLNDQPVQVIRPSGRLCLPLVDLSALTTALSEATRLVEQERRQACDLARGPLLRCTLLRLQPGEHILLLTLHHIIADGWSLQVLKVDLTALYLAVCRGETPALPPLAVQYADYALWQRAWLQGAVLATHLDYWRVQLAAASVLRLPLDHPRPAQHSYRGAAHRFRLPAALSTALEALSRQEHLTLFMLLLAAWQILLARFCQQEDILVGSDVANRNHLETEPLIGFFINQIVLRSRVRGDLPLRTFLGQVRQTALAAYLHQELPFEQLVDALRSEHAQPLFQVKFLLDQQPGQGEAGAVETQAADLSISAFSLLPETTQLDLLLRISQSKQGLTGTLTYCRDLFEAGTIEGLARQFVALLTDICAHPEARVHTLELASQEEKEQQHMQEQKHAQNALSRLKTLKPRPLSLQQTALIQTSSLADGQTQPLVVRPAVEDIDLAEWAQGNRAYLESELCKHGALLFRGFHLPTPAAFERFARAYCSDLLSENGEHVPARDVGDGHLYTPVFYAPEKKLLWHSENSFNAHFPRTIWFFCARAAQQGGETPIADNRRVLQSLPAEICEQFARKQILYIRNYHEGLGQSWQSIFQTSEKAEVQARCRSESIDFTWGPHDRLRTSQLRPAVIKHPRTGEWLWWNQAAHWHPACLDPGVRASLQELFAPEDLPRTCTYGDGSPIADETMAAICQAYQEAEVSFPWQEGDILMLDNLLVAHARNPYSGPRKIYVTMGGMASLQDLEEG
jgi:amino acid adenylation domain-containing protein